MQSGNDAEQLRLANARRAKKSHYLALNAIVTDNIAYLRVHIAHLREKIEADPSKPELIITEPAVGYRLLPKG